MDKNQCNSTSLCQHNWPLGIEGSDSIVISWKWQGKSEQRKRGTLDSVSMCTQFHSRCFSHHLPAFPLTFVSDPAYHVWFCPQSLSRCCTALLHFSQYNSIPSVFLSFLVWNWCFVPPLSGGALTQPLKWMTKPCCFVFCVFVCLKEVLGAGRRCQAGSNEKHRLLFHRASRARVASPVLWCHCDPATGDRSSPAPLLLPTARWSTIHPRATTFLLAVL